MFLSSYWCTKKARSALYRKGSLISAHHTAPKPPDRHATAHKNTPQPPETMSQIQNRAIRDRPLLSGPGTVSLSALTDAQRIRVFLAEANHPTRALAYGDIDRHAILNVSASEMSECYVTVGEEEGMVRLGIEDLTQKNGTVKREVERVPVSTANERVLWRFKTSSFNKSVVLVEEGVVPAIVGIEAGLKEKIKERRKKNKGTGPGEFQAIRRVH